MGSPVSVVVAEIVMQNIEEQALSTYTKTLPLWLRYVNDTFTAVHKDEVYTFRENLNRQNSHIQFTKEIEENGKIPFPDCLVSREENNLRTTIYRKPTHTDRLLDQSPNNSTSHKAMTIRTLTRRAQLVSDSTDSLTDENNYLNKVFSGCGHTTELNRDLASKSRLTSNHDLANNRDLIYFLSDYRVKSRFVTVNKTVSHAKTQTDDIGCVVCNTK